MKFKLSEKEIWAEIDYKNGDTGSILVFPSKDIKEFIRLLKEKGMDDDKVIRMSENEVDELSGLKEIKK